ARPFRQRAVVPPDPVHPRRKHLRARTRAAGRALAVPVPGPGVVVPRFARWHVALPRADPGHCRLLQHRGLQRRHPRVPVDPGAAGRRAPHRLRGAGETGRRTPHRGGRGGRSRRRPRLPPAEGGLPPVSRRTAPVFPRDVAAAALLLLAFLLVAAAPAFAAQDASPRTSVLLDDGWRFHLGDPPGVDGRLDYDVRPEVERSADGRVADARPDEAVHLDADRPVLKPWILPTANRFIADPAARHARPAHEP